MSLIQVACESLQGQLVISFWIPSYADATLSSDTNISHICGANNILPFFTFLFNQQYIDIATNDKYVKMTSRQLKYIYIVAYTFDEKLEIEMFVKVFVLPMASFANNN